MDAQEQPLMRPMPSSSGEDDEDDGSMALQLLHRGTLVCISGNNRTKQELIGQRGKIKKSVGLGGWHWLKLHSGEEVRLQRNALTVLEPPSNQESDFSEEEDNAANQTEALPRMRARRPPRPLAPSPEISHQRRASVRQSSQPRINFHNLETAALKRYRRFYKLPDVGPNSSKEQLVMAVGRHFMAQTVDESKVIALFVAAARRAALEPREV
ncbi:probable histone deacetylase complex subunit SAP30 at C-terminar half [Coccomyxa sp. Obi]|nr:probable histone deacetylase complex subunit SAP30 at C-terminar half [Coccomyxa sp. Obi]